MRCRICGNEITCSEVIHSVMQNTNNVYQRFAVEKFVPLVYGYCGLCKHGQLENTLEQEYYEAYDLLKVDNVSLEKAGEEKPGKMSYYLGVLHKLQKISDDNKVLDIGCGQGKLLEYARGIFQEIWGVEPSKEECRIALDRGNRVVNDFFDERFAETDFSAFTCTQVLEHLDRPEVVVQNAFRVLKEGGAGYVEVPNGELIYRSSNFYDVVIDHINYYSVTSLTRLLSEAGFQILSVGEEAGGAHIGAYVKKPGNRICSFDERMNNNLNCIRALKQDFKTIAVWGAGMKGRAFLKQFAEEMGEQLIHIFDSNRGLEGMYVANCMIPIEIPDTEKLAEAEVIVLTAMEYCEEIKQDLRGRFAYRGKLVAISEM